MRMLHQTLSSLRRSTIASAASFLFVLSLGLFSACTEEPGPLGISLLPRQDALKVDSVSKHSLTTSFYRSRFAGSSGVLMTGRSQGIEARTLLQFNAIQQLPAGATLDSATITVRPVYRFRDSTGELGFRVHTMRRLWSELTFTWDSLTTGSYSDTVAGSFVQVITPADTLLRIRIDTAVAASWIRAQSAGVVFLPSPTTNIIVGFSNVLSSLSDRRPALTFFYRDTSSDTTQRITQLPGSRIYVADVSPGSFPDRMFIQAGISYRARCAFDLSSIPKNASITHARLTLSLDSSNSIRNSYSTNTVIAHAALTDTSDPILSGITAIGSPVAGAPTTYVFEVNALVQRSVTTGGDFGFVFRAGGESTTLDRYVFFGTGALRPRLNITYTLLP